MIENTRWVVRGCYVLVILILVNVTTLFAQKKIEVTGKVFDAQTHDPLPGVNVVIKGTTIGTATKPNGNYKLAVPSMTDTLVFSYIGYTRREVSIRGRSRIDIGLKSSAVQGQELVVVGYGTTQKKDLTGAVGTVSSEQIENKGTTDPLSALQGQVAGVNITANTGLPGASYKIDIRGMNSFNGGNPLFVVDGVITDNIDFLNPDDIKSIDILKDASSTAIYGSRGSNGVVIVTTKSGSGMKGKTQFSYSGYVGVRSFSHMPHFLNYQQGITYTMNRDITKKLYRGQNLTAPDNMFGFPSSGSAHEYWKNVLASGQHTDWVGLLTKPAIQTNHFITASGGTDKMNYLIGAGYQADNGNVTGQYYNKYNFQANIDAHVSYEWSMGANINLAYTYRHLESQNLMKQLFRMPPWAPAYDSTGAVIQEPMVGISGNVSPLDEMKYNQDNISNDYLISNFYLQFQPAQWLSLKSTFSPNAQFGQDGVYWDPLSTKSSAGGQMTKTQQLSYIWDNQISIRKQLTQRQRVNYDFIYSMQMNRNNTLYGFGWDLPFDSQYYNLGEATYLSTSSNFQQSSLMSFTNRVNYSFNDKYLLTVTARWDGSSKLAPGHKWAFFPSAAVAWRLSQEKIIKRMPFISNLKLRLSFGYTGNDNIPPYTTQFDVNTQTYYDWNGKLATGFQPSAIANKDLTWERTREWDLGMDFGFLENRISGEVDLYDKLSNNLLMQRKLAVPTGWASMEDNIGSVSNRGIEIQLKTINLRSSNFLWTTTFTFASNKNSIVSLYGKKQNDVPNRWFIGQPIDVVYALVFDGVWQKNELPPSEQQKMEGTAKVKDLNGDGKIDQNDMKVLGSPFPKWTGGLTTTFNFKNFDLSASFYTKQGVFEYSPFYKEFTDFNSKQILDVPYYMRANPYTKARYSNTYPQPAYMGDYYGENAGAWGYPGFNKDASFVRLKDVTLGYQVSRSVLKKLGIGVTSLRVYFNALNPFVWTKFGGFDPEWAGASMSGDEQNSPGFSIYQFGANIKF